MNLSLLLQNKAAQVLRQWVRPTDGIPVFTSAALAQRSLQRPSGCSVAEERKTPGRPLRVLQVLEKNAPKSTVGRMVISGSMADVCAELDRLLAKEAALH